MKNILLYPLSLLYGFIVFVRNRLYDYKFFKSKEFDVPVISIGNITVGGTGKTPHTEYLVSLMQKHFKVATLSRGYKRKTKGNLEVQINSTALEAGDEPLQIKNKFPDIQVFVDEKRVRGIEKILTQETAKIPDVILLDDAFQHRSVSPGLNILLIDYNRPINRDKILPAGRLRESHYEMRRANIIIFTKCPQEIQPITRRIIMKDVNLRPYQTLYFTTMVYGLPRPVFPELSITHPDLSKKAYSFLLVTGIANPEHLKIYLKKFTDEIRDLQFSDHHNFKKSDIQQIEKLFLELETENKLIITTEKDSMRLRDVPDLPDFIKSHLYYIPLEIKFLGTEGKNFDEKITNYVRENKSNRELHQRTYKAPR